VVDLVVETLRLDAVSGEPRCRVLGRDWVVVNWGVELLRLEWCVVNWGGEVEAGLVHSERGYGHVEAGWGVVGLVVQMSGLDL
jgi:hypothetical protein